jgi:hypothetical protein
VKALRGFVGWVLSRPRTSRLSRDSEAPGYASMLLEGSQLEMFGDDILSQRSQPGYTEYASKLLPLSRTRTDRVIGA